jgi:hypothetical protein
VNLPIAVPLDRLFPPPVIPSPPVMPMTPVQTGEKGNACAGT